ncbi:Uronate isomerase [Trichinella spiralis]|uniref:Uronate isomerase n=1 Tax=Trichinella spiralis TaxID=6334 RepID=A0ABR3KGW1_TRISP
MRTTTKRYEAILVREKMYKFIVFIALIAVQLTASAASKNALDDESAIQEALITLDKQSHAHILQIDIQEECKDTDVSYKCKFVYFNSYGYDASVDCLKITSDDSNHANDEESAIQEALITFDKESHAAYFTKLLQIIAKIEEADQIVFKINATSTVCSSKDEVIDVPTVKSICTEKMPLLECTVALQKPSLQYSAASCSEVDISSLPLKSVKSENAALVGSAMHSVEYALYRVDSERRSGFYKKFKDIIDVYQYGIVTVIEAKAVETDCAVIDDDGIVDVEEDCKDTDVSYKCKFVYFYSYGYDASVDCVKV